MFGPAGRMLVTLNLRDIIVDNRAGKRRGSYAVCSAHPWVIDAAVQRALETSSLLHVESTASQVNQFGGYSGKTPREFAAHIHTAARSAGLAPDQVVLGGDHIGPFPWRQEAAENALAKALVLVRDCVQAAIRRFILTRACPARTTVRACWTITPLRNGLLGFAGSLKKLRRVAVLLLRSRFT
jgi:D-tagatose-1,6-bisphosphate aldolase subunit GatZ/KbaZ